MSDQRFGWGVLLLCFALVRSAGGASSVIEITNVPPYGSTQNLGGRVLNASPGAHRVVVCIYVPGAGWWSKPYCGQLLTTISPDGSWTTDITTGGSDPLATQITALLVSSTYNEPCVEGLPSIPASVLDQAVASATVTRYDPAIRRVRFSGYDWWVKASAGPVGPGPNLFSDGLENVWVDNDGFLHMRITRRSGQWYCAEIVSERTFGYGSYRFELGSVVNDLDANAILGLFTWSDDPAYAHREIDIECARWGNGSDQNNAQFVVQPWEPPGHLVRYRVPPGMGLSTHLFTWETNRVRFLSLAGSYTPSPGASNVLRNWTYTLDTPQTGDENVRINLWLNGGNPPAGGQEVEFVIRSFRFVPLGKPEAAELKHFEAGGGGEVKFAISGKTDWHYEVQASTNLADWEALQTVLATNTLMDFLDTNGSLPRRFFRALTLP